MTAQDQDKFILRLPDGMRDQIKAEALVNERSMNAEIIARLSGTQANLRDQIAMRALPIILNSIQDDDLFEFGGEARAYCVIATEAYAIADAMLEARQP